MVSVNVKLYMGPSGIKERGFEGIKTGGSILSLIDEIDKKTEGGFKKVLFNNRGNLHPYVNIMINGKRIEDINESLNDGDEVSFMVIRPLAGG